MSLDDSADHLLLADLSIGHDSSSHLVQFYENDAYLVDSVSRAIGESLENGDGAVDYRYPGLIARRSKNAS